jgi:DNA-binding NtrC family response regulator
MKTLQSYRFPGNVRELDSILKQAVIISDNDILDEFIVNSLGGYGKKMDEPFNEKYNLSAQVQKLEKEMLEEAILKCKTTREMAKFLGLNQSNVVRKLKKYGLSGSKLHKAVL